MTEKNENQDPNQDPTQASQDPNQSPEQVTEEEAGKEQTPQLSVEELAQAVTELTAEGQRKETEIKRLQGLVKAAQAQGAPKAEIEALKQGLANMEMSHAKLMDYLETHLGEGEEIQTPTTQKKSHVQILEESREAATKAAEETIKRDPDAQKFVAFMISQGLEVTDPIVLEATDNGNRPPAEALKILKAKVKENSDAGIKQRVSEGVAETLKKLGVTSTGVLNPSAPSGAWREKSPEAKILQGVTEK